MNNVASRGFASTVMIGGSVGKGTLYNVIRDPLFGLYIHAINLDLYT